MAGSIALDLRADTALVTLANAGKRNAIDIAMWRELRAIFERLQALAPADAPRAVLVRGADGQFASGGDIVEFAEFRFDEQRLHDFHEGIVAPALHAMLDCDLPIWAQIEGACIGGGLEIAACCDIRIAGAGSRYGAPIAKLGFPMAPGELEIVARITPAPVLREMLLEARLLDAADAFRLGLVHAVVPDAEVAADDPGPGRAGGVAVDRRRPHQQAHPPAARRRRPDGGAAPRPVRLRRQPRAPRRRHRLHREKNAALRLKQRAWRPPR